MSILKIENRLRKTAEYLSDSAENTREIARNFASGLKSNDVVALIGDLGSGKTCWVKGVADGLGIKDAVHSPTFLIVHEYKNDRLNGILYHMDFYRIKHFQELENIGIYDYLYSDGIVMVEWADKFINIMPPKAVYIKFEIKSKKTRKITIMR